MFHERLLDAILAGLSWRCPARFYVLGLWPCLAMTPIHASEPPRCPPVQVQQLTSPSCDEFMTFGRRLSVFGDRMAEGHYEGGGGSVTTYMLDATGAWRFEAELQPSEPLEPIDDFGSAVAFQDETSLAVGSKSESAILRSAGTTYVFKYDDVWGRWIEQAQVVPEVIVEFEWFGAALTWASAEDSRLLVVGAPGSEFHDLPGSVYTFEEAGDGTWIQRSQLSPPGGGTPNGAFGYRLDAVEGNSVTLLIVGAPVYLFQHGVNPAGSAHVFRFDVSSGDWALEASFQAPDPYVQDFFGSDVAIGTVNDEQGITHRAVVGRANEGGFGNAQGPGAVYTYVRHIDGTWTPEAHLLPPISRAGDHRFGWSVDIEPDGANRLLVGAPADPAFGVASGSAYVFERDAASEQWEAVQGMFALDGDALDTFGAAAELGSGASAGQALIGAEQWECPGESDLATVGAVYAFDLDPADDETGDCPSPVLRLVGDGPDCGQGRSGDLEARWFYASPGGSSSRVALLLARQAGIFTIPPGRPCAETTLDLGTAGLRLAYQGPAGRFGTGLVKAQVPAGLCGSYLQLLDLTSCKTSNVIRIE